MKPSRLLLAASAAAVALAVSTAASAQPAEPQKPDPDPWFGPDKTLHFALSFMIASGAYGFAALATRSAPARFGVGAGVGLGAGVAKELYDLTGRGDPSWRDLAWDAIGVAAGLGVAFALDRATQSPGAPGAAHPVAAAIVW